MIGFVELFIWISGLGPRHKELFNLVDGSAGENSRIVIRSRSSIMISVQRLRRKRKKIIQNYDSCYKLPFLID